MKTKKIYLILISILLTCPVFVSANGKMQMQSKMQQNTQGWTQNPGLQTTDRGNAIQPGETPSPDPNVPVGDTAWTLILGMGLTYGAYTFSRKRKESQK